MPELTEILFLVLVGALTLKVGVNVVYRGCAGGSYFT